MIWTCSIFFNMLRDWAVYESTRHTEFLLRGIMIWTSGVRDSYGLSPFDLYYIPRTTSPDLGITFSVIPYSAGQDFPISASFFSFSYGTSICLRLPLHASAIGGVPGKSLILSRYRRLPVSLVLFDPNVCPPMKRRCRSFLGRMTTLSLTTFPFIFLGTGFPPVPTSPYHLILRFASVPFRMRTLACTRIFSAAPLPPYGCRTSRALLFGSVER
jgi:hypothetical protein